MPRSRMGNLVLRVRDVVTAHPTMPQHAPAMPLPSTTTERRGRLCRYEGRPRRREGEIMPVRGETMSVRGKTTPGRGETMPVPRTTTERMGRPYWYEGGPCRFEGRPCRSATRCVPNPDPSFSLLTRKSKSSTCKLKLSTCKFRSTRPLRCPFQGTHPPLSPLTT